MSNPSDSPKTGTQKTDIKNVRKGRRRARAFPKGRQVSPDARDTVRKILADRPRRRDLLIEHLHLFQDHFGHLSAPILTALAAEMKLSMAEVFETATFYHHFDVITDGAAPPPPLTIRVCDSLPCMMAGGDSLAAELQKKSDPKKLRVLRAPCMGRCAAAPVAAVGRRHVDHADADALVDLARNDRRDPVIPDYPDLTAYGDSGGYKILEACRSGKMTPDSVIAMLEAAGLRGLGGAGFPTARKWSLVRAEPAPRYLAVNADEGEPGTFKDRFYMESDPHRFLEGVLIAAWAVEAVEAYIYLRDEYPAAHAVLSAEIARLEDAGMVKPGYVILRRGAGAYICGEESAMLESIEGKRGLPRHRPPFAAQVGLFGRPTLIHNVETLCWLRPIIEKGAEEFAAQGKPGHPGPRSYSVSGRVKKPGVCILPAGSSVREIIDHCGGMMEGHTFAAYLPGGASGGLLPAALGDLPLDFGALDEHGCFVGSHAVVILSDRDDVRIAALNLLRFFEHESCGQCTPCRVGCEKAVRLLQSDNWDAPLLTELSQAMADASICGLGQAAPNPILSVLKFFPPVGAAR